MRATSPISTWEQGPYGRSKVDMGWSRALIIGQVRHQRLVLYLIYLQAFKMIYLQNLQVLSSRLGPYHTPV